MKKSISVIIPLYNEERNLEAIITNINDIVSSLFDDYELLIFDDASTDKTGDIIDMFAKKNSKIKVFHNKKNMNTGYNFRMGIKYATKKYTMLLAAPDMLIPDSLKNYMTKTGTAAIVSNYVRNKKARLLYRRIISYLVTAALNLMFGLHIKYYLGQLICESKAIKEVRTTTNSFGLPAEVFIRLVKKGSSYKEFPIDIRKMKENSTSAFRIRNIAGFIAMVLRLFFEINFNKKKRKSSWL